MNDPRLFAPSVPRNRDPILDVLRTILPPKGLVLEIASGSGEHVAHFAAALPGLTFQPSDPNPEARASIDAWTAQNGLPNIRPALALDASRPPWPLSQAVAIICINMVHISPWAASQGLFRQASEILQPGGAFYLYGAFLREGVLTAPSNIAFDGWLRGQNLEWGLRDLAVVGALARENGFAAPEVIEMPSNNLSVIFRRT
jgi:SAM-dependent methyltransferase